MNLFSRFLTKRMAIFNSEFDMYEEDGSDSRAISPKKIMDAYSKDVLDSVVSIIISNDSEIGTLNNMADTFPNVENIRIDSTKGEFFDLRAIVDFDNLTSFYIEKSSYSYIKGLELIPSLVQLQYLGLSLKSNSLKVFDFSKMKNLQNLCLEGFNSVDLTDIKISSPDVLRRLALSDTMINNTEKEFNQWVGSFKNLQELTLKDLNLPLKSLNLENLRNLNYLFINRLTVSEILNLVVDNLRILNIEDCSFLSSIKLFNPDSLSTIVFPKLNQLIMRDNPLKLFSFYPSVYLPVQDSNGGCSLLINGEKEFSLSELSRIFNNNKFLLKAFSSRESREINSMEFISA